MNFFASDVFLESLAWAYHRGRPHAIERVGVEGRTFRLLRIGRRGWILDWPFLDLHEPLEDGGPAEPREEVPWVPKVALRETDAEGWRAVAGTPDTYVAPYVDWTVYADFDGWLQHVRSRRKRQWKNIESRSRRLEQEVGPVTVELDDDDPGIVDLCLSWKSRHCRLSGIPDVYRREETRRFFHALSREGVLETACLRVGGRPVAMHLGARFEGRFHAWIPAYDWSLYKFAPGLVLFHRMMEASYRAGDRAFDFLIGDEDFKWFYANRARLLAPVGTPPMPMRVWKPVRRALGAAVRQQPKLWAALNAARRQVEPLLPPGGITAR